ncbi:MAG: EAL domain-containing protein [Rhodocyclaceae bacterium]|jgi:diguanylate cyclase (GGDEF)-like protein/PAS domain S-box-containing protein|nr:EAL domain-containing protein [Rhodocyclaceae bacterium]
MSEDPRACAGPEGKAGLELPQAEQERIVQMQLSLLSAVAAGEPRRQVLDLLCTQCEALVPGTVASLMVLDDETGALRVVAAPSLPSVALARIHGLRPGPNAPGSALLRTEAAFVADTGDDPHWARIRDLAQDFRWRAWWSAPVSRGGQAPVASFALASFEPRQPNPFQRRLLKIGAQIAGVVLPHLHQRKGRRIAERVLSSVEESITVTDAHNRIRWVNPAFTRVTGYTLPEVLGQTPRVLSSGRHGPEFYQAMWSHLLAEGHWQGEIWNRRKDGHVYPEWLSISLVHDSRGKVTNHVAIFSDITQRKAAEARIAYLASHDSLTGLPNRSLARDRLDTTLARAQRQGTQVAVLFVDLDNFKLVNDSLGHAAGDALLMQVARRLCGCVRQSDTVSRHGGDEFILILSEVGGAANASEVAEKILTAMDLPFVADGLELSTSLSIGIALYPDDGNDFDALVQRADIAMFHAKEAGRNGFRFYAPQMQAQGTERLRMRHDLRKALERDELCLHYQPQIDLASGLVVGVEALLRWQHPELGTVLPDRFIPLAEVSGLMVPIGEWVLNEACRQAAAWQAEGLTPVQMSVNLSAIQFRRGNLEQSIQAALASAALDPARLTLEITESILMHDSEATASMLQRLKALGLRLAIDDFGTGYSSLAYLRRFAVDALKIDRSFIHDMGTDPDAAAIVDAILQMAHSLKLKVVAEGVEDHATSRRLAAAGCALAQGYHFGRPMPAESLSAYLQSWNSG